MALTNVYSKEIILQYYWQGWRDCCNEQQKKVIEDKFLQHAYDIGEADYITGDDVRSVDYQTEEQIIKKIVDIYEN